MTTQKFEVLKELPPGRTKRAEPIDWEGAKQAMIDNAPDWVKIVENISTSTPHQLRRGDNRQFQGEEIDKFEFVTRKPQDAAKAATYRKNFTDLYGRYVAGPAPTEGKPKRGRK
jgi:hypothetical protein